MRRKRKKVGLALGSGGARGFAHLGVLKTLSSGKIPIDYLVGCSVGAIVGAYYAVHGEIESFEKLMLGMKRRELVSFLDLRAPTRSLIRGKKMLAYLDKLYEHRSFKETKIPFEVVATDLRKGVEVRLRRGNLAEEVMASAAFPGVFPPVKKGRKLLVDGGIVNSTPVDVARKMGAEVVLGVDLTMKGNLMLQDPSVFEVLTRSFDILRTQAIRLTTQKVASEDLIIIKPKLSYKTGLGDFVKSFREKEKLIKKGSRATKEAMSKIKRLLD